MSEMGIWWIDDPDRSRAQSEPARGGRVDRYGEYQGNGPCIRILRSN